MAATEIKVQMQQRRDTASGWNSSGAVLLAGELGFETDTGNSKLGDGSTPWAGLSYLNDVSSVPSGTAASPGFAFANDSNTGIFRPGGDKIATSTSGVERLRIDANGRIIIGAIQNSGAGRVQSHTESSSNPNFAALRFIEGSGGPTVDFFKSRGTTSGTHALVSSGDNLGRITFKGSNGSLYRTAAAINVRVDGPPGLSNDMPGRIEFETTPDESATSQIRMVIKNSGDVGIGTTSPDARLHVSGATKFDGNIQINNSGSFASQSRASNIRFGFGGNDGAAIKTVVASGASSESECVLDVMTGGGTANERRLRIDETGRVCVGALPSAVASIANVDAGLIQTSGNIDIRYEGANSDPGGARYLSFINTDAALAANQPMGGIRWVGNDSENPSTDCASILAYNEGAAGLVSNIVFSNFGAERMRIRADGSVNISSGGLTFNNDTAAANALDDYEEGTFTPGIQGATNAGTYTPGTIVGRYTKTGRSVSVTISLKNIAIGANGSGAINITSLPFAAAVATVGGCLLDNFGLDSDTRYVVAFLNSSSSIIELRNIKTNTEDTAIQVEAIGSGGTPDLLIQMTYDV